MSDLCIEEIAYLSQNEKPKEEGTRGAIMNEALVHLNTSTKTGKESLGVSTVKNLGPRGSKHKILKIKNN